MIAAKQYGPILIPRGRCPACNHETLIATDGTSLCCGAPTLAYESGTVDYVCNADGKRKPLTKKMRERLLLKYGYHCYWCEVEFGRYACNENTGRIWKLNPVWDHYIPHAYTGSSLEDQFVPSCRICNAYKSAKHIVTEMDEDKLREYILTRWRVNKWSLV